MKFGYRKPSASKSIKARTTGKYTRQAKKITTPGYGAKGKGVINDPKRAAYNKIYNSTTKSAFNNSSSSDTDPLTDYSQSDTPSRAAQIWKAIGVGLAIFGIYNALRGELDFWRIIYSTFISIIGITIVTIAKS